jgi:AmmeMemoRadiSam system protein B
MEKEKYRGIRKRAAVVDGIFYPDNAEAIVSALNYWGVKECLDSSFFGGQVIFAPHGAWGLTGETAAAAFKAVTCSLPGSVLPAGNAHSLSKSTEAKGDSAFPSGNGNDTGRVLLLGARHGPGEDGVFLSESAFYSTPLGNLQVDSKMNLKLSSCSTMIAINDIPHLTEHSLEVLLPFVKFCFPKAKIVPILMGGTKPALVSSLARALKVSLEKLTKETLIIVSSNVSSSPDPAFALSMAGEFSALLEKADAKTFAEKLREGRLSACGAALMAALLESGLLRGKGLVSLSPLVSSKGEHGETVYYGAFASGSRPEGTRGN